MIVFLAFLALAFADSDCAPRDFVNSSSSPSVIAANFGRNIDVDDESTFGDAGSLTFTLSMANFATLDEVNFEGEGEDNKVDDSIIGVNSESFTANGCNNEYTSNAIGWMDIKDFLMLKTTGNPETDNHTDLHYRAEIVVKTTNPYAPNTFEHEGVDAMDGEERTRSVTSTFQLYFTLPERVQAWARITIAELPTAGVVENIQMQDVTTTLNREDLTYSTVVGLHSTINWPYILTHKSATSTEAVSVGVTENDLSTRVDCDRSGDEDDEPDCQQFWTITIDYGTSCGDAVGGDLDLVFTHTNLLPNEGEETVMDNGTSEYTIEVSTSQIQCVVDAGDIDVFATLAHVPGSTFVIGGAADFTFEISNLETPGVVVTHLALEQVRTTQDGETRLTHVENGAAVTGTRDVGGVAMDFGGDGGNSAVTLTDTSTANGGKTGFNLNFHQTIFNLDKFVDGSTETLRVDATGVITYGDSGRRRRRLISVGHRLKASSQTAVQIAYHCGHIAEKTQCKTAKTTDGRCKWSKRSCTPKKKVSACTKLGPKKCRKNDKCIFRHKTKSCSSYKKLKCADIAHTAELCFETPGCLTVLSNKIFKGCRGMVKMG